MLKKSPSQAELNQLINLINNGNFAAAEIAATTLSKTYPKAIVVWKILGVAIAQQDRIAEAIAPMQKVIQLDPKDAEAHRNLATALKELGQIKTAEAHFRKSITLNAQDPLTHTALAKTLNEQNNFAEAEKHCRKAIALKYDIAEAHDQLGIALLRQQKLADAESSFKAAIMLYPEMADAHNNLGIVLNEQKKYAEAEACYHQAIKLDPGFANAYNNLAYNFFSQNQLTEAEVLLQQAIALKPQFPEAINTLGNVYKDLGNIHRAIEYYRKAIAIAPALTVSYSNLLLAAVYDETLSSEIVAEEAKEYGRYVALQTTSRYTSWHCPLPLDTAKNKIRVGFVSGDLRKHAVTFFLEGLLRHFNKDAFELIAYSTQPIEDDVTALIKPHFTKWQVIHGKSNQEAAAIIYQDAPHILFDVSGHTANNRLPVFAYKPAPIQVTWLGYPATTGLAEMDYVLGDPYLIPATDEYLFVEKVWRLPEITWCFNPMLEDIPIAELPALKNQHITFGCFNNLAKVNDKVIKIWSDILHAVPTAKLYLQAGQLNTPSVREKFYAKFLACGIKADRLILEGGGTREHYFHSFNKVDIALDPFPCPGGTTSADTLWMSVPVLTIKKQGYSTRIGETIAHNVGLADWIAEDTQDYIQKAVTFAADLPALAELRTKLRPQVMASPLFNIVRYTQHFEAALRGMINSFNVNK